MDSPTGTKPWSRGLQEEKNGQSYNERYKKPVPCIYIYKTVVSDRVLTLKVSSDTIIG